MISSLHLMWVIKWQIPNNNPSSQTRICTLGTGRNKNIEDLRIKKIVSGNGKCIFFLIAAFERNLWLNKTGSRDKERKEKKGFLKNYNKSQLVPTITALPECRITKSSLETKPDYLGGMRKKSKFLHLRLKQVSSFAWWIFDCINRVIFIPAWWRSMKLRVWQQWLSRGSNKFTSYS